MSKNRVNKKDLSLASIVEAMRGMNSFELEDFKVKVLAVFSWKEEELKLDGISKVLSNKKFKEE